MANHDLIHKQLSLSGFPFQLRIEKEIRLNEKDHGWSVVTREQAWTNTEAQNSGFIDIVLIHNQLSTLRLVIECKRQRGDDARTLQWLFLIPEEDAVEKDTVRCLSTESWRETKYIEGFDGELNRPTKTPVEEYRSLRIWDDVRITPASLESQFCVMQSDDSRRQPILESLCREILDSVDGLAEEEISIAKTQTSLPQVRAFYIPIVVTNAKLVACSFNVEDISLSDGIIPRDKCKLETISFIRFRKSFASEFPNGYTLSDLRQANEARERTIFVVNSESLQDYLKGWRIKPLNEFHGFALQQQLRRETMQKLFDSSNT